METRSSTCTSILGQYRSSLPEGWSRASWEEQEERARLVSYLGHSSLSRYPSLTKLGYLFSKRVT